MNTLGSIHMSCTCDHASSLCSAHQKRTVNPASHSGAPLLDRNIPSHIFFCLWMMFQLGTCIGASMYNITIPTSHLLEPDHIHTSWLLVVYLRCKSTRNVHHRPGHHLWKEEWGLSSFILDLLSIHLLQSSRPSTVVDPKMLIYKIILEIWENLNIRIEQCAVQSLYCTWCCRHKNSGRICQLQ